MLPARRSIDLAFNSSPTVLINYRPGKVEQKFNFLSTVLVNIGQNFGFSGKNFKKVNFFSKFDVKFGQIFRVLQRFWSTTANILVF